MQNFQILCEEIDKSIKICDSAYIYRDKCYKFKLILQEILEVVSKEKQAFTNKEINKMLDEIKKIYDNILKFDFSSYNQTNYDQIVKNAKKEVYTTLDNIIKMIMAKNISINNINELTISQYKLSSEQFTNLKRIPTIANTYDLYCGINQKDNHKVKLTVFEKKYPKDKFNNNVKLLTRINHPNLERFLGYYEEPNLTIASIEEGQSLSSIYEKYFSKHTEDIEDLEYDNDETDEYENTSNGIKKGYLTIIAYEVALGMGYLHSNKIIHRDLCSENITINYASEDGSVAKISNFASSRYIPNNYQIAMTQDPAARGKFRAPEINSGEIYTESVDVFSYGGLLYELLTGHSPYYDKKADEVDKLISEKERPDIPDEAGEKLKKLINHCWSQESKDRPTFSEIIYYLISNHITFPGEKDNETTKQYYSKHEIKNKNIKECLIQFDEIMKLIKTAFVYEYEAQRVGTLLIRYMFYLETSEYSKNETTSNNQNDTELNKIKNQLKKLINTLIYTTREKWSTIYLTSPVTEITEQLQQVMRSIYDSMNRLGFNLQKPYYLKNSDISFDYRELYDIFNELEKEEVQKEETKNEKEESSENNFDCNDNEEEEEEGDNYGYYDDDDDDDDDDDSNSSTPTKGKEDLVRIKLKPFESRLKLIKERKLEVEKFLKDHNIEVKLTSTEIDSRLHNLLDNWKDWRVDRNDFKILEGSNNILGDGLSCNVFKGKQLSTKKHVAIKIFKESYIDNDELLPLIRREISSLVTLKNKFLVNFVGFNIDAGQQPWIITEFVNKENLKGMIKSEKLTILEKTKIAFEIAQGMEYLHSNQVIHRDLKPQNILIDLKKTPKICDFGFARKNISVVMTAFRGTGDYMAPEVQENSGNYSYKADVYSYGVILYEMIFKHVPYSDFLFNSKSKINDNMKKLIESCLSTKPNDRPTFYQIIQYMLEFSVSFNATNDIPSYITDFYDQKKENEKYLLDFIKESESNDELSKETNSCP